MKKLLLVLFLIVNIASVFAHDNIAGLVPIREDQPGNPGTQEDFMAHGRPDSPSILRSTGEMSAIYESSIFQTEHKPQSTTESAFLPPRGVASSPQTPPTGSLNPPMYGVFQVIQSSLSSNEEYLNRIKLIAQHELGKQSNIEEITRSLKTFWDTAKESQQISPKKIVDTYAEVFLIVKNLQEDLKLLFTLLKKFPESITSENIIGHLGIKYLESQIAGISEIPEDSQNKLFEHIILLTKQMNLLRIPREAVLSQTVSSACKSKKLSIKKIIYLWLIKCFPEEINKPVEIIEAYLLEENRRNSSSIENFLETITALRKEALIQFGPIDVIDAYANMTFPDGIPQYLQTFLPFLRRFPEAIDQPVENIFQYLAEREIRNKAVNDAISLEANFTEENIINVLKELHEQLRPLDVGENVVVDVYLEKFREIAKARISDRVKNFIDLLREFPEQLSFLDTVTPLRTLLLRKAEERAESLIPIWIYNKSLHHFLAYIIPFCTSGTDINPEEIFLHYIETFLPRMFERYHDRSGLDDIYVLWKYPGELLKFGVQDIVALKNRIDELKGDVPDRIAKFIKRAANQQKNDFSRGIISSWWGFGDDWIELLAAINSHKVTVESVISQYDKQFGTERPDIVQGLEAKIKSHSSIIQMAAKRQKEATGALEWCGFDMSDDGLEKKVLFFMAKSGYCYPRDIVALYAEYLGEDYQYKDATLKGFAETFIFDPEILNSTERYIRCASVWQDIHRMEGVQPNMYALSEEQWNNLIWMKNFPGSKLTKKEIVDIYQSSLQHHKTGLSRSEMGMIMDLAKAVESNMPYPH